MAPCTAYKVLLTYVNDKVHIPRLFEREMASVDSMRSCVIRLPPSIVFDRPESISSNNDD